jgi:hypothetical protein
MFAPGQKIICVKACWLTLEQVLFYPWPLPPSPLPQKGRRYTCREITHAYGPPYVGLHEYPVDFWFDASRFRPIEERDTSIEIFRKLLQPTGTRKLEDA